MCLSGLRALWAVNEVIIPVRNRWRVSVKARRPWRFAAGLLMLATGAWAQLDPLPPVAAKLSAVFQPGPDWPAVPFQLTATPLRPPDAGGWHVQVEANLPGGPVLIQAELAPDAESARWVLPGQRWPLAAWRDLLIKQLPELRDWEFQGELEVSGRGEWSDGAVGGELALRMTLPRVAGALAAGLEANGVEVVATVTVADNGPTAITATLAVSTLKVADGQVELRDVAAKLSSEDGQRWRIADFVASLWSGEVSADGFTYDPEAPAVVTTVHIDGVDAAALAPFLSSVIADVSGRLDGSMLVRWSPGEGLVPGRGRLSLAAAASNQLHLAAQPGLLTSRLPPRIDVLPAWLGPLARWAAVENPAYAPLAEIELGRAAVQVDELALDLYPDGPDGARSLRLEVAGRPVASTAIGTVRFTVNVTGPLQELIELGLNEKARVSFPVE